MTERIDHAKAADVLMKKLASAPAMDDEHDVEWGFREAQVHATLAVAAELRTANLIAARAQSEFPRIDLRDNNSWETVQLETDERIRERLGLS